MAAWYVLIHQLPPDPPYLRAKIAHRLARIGALPLKNAVYLLPQRPSCLEDFQWVVEEAAASGGTAYVAAAEWVAGVSDEELRGRFAAARAADYRTLAGELRAEIEGSGAGRGGGRLAALRQRLAEIAAIDWFAAPGRDEVEALLARFESAAQRRGEAPDPARGTALAELRGRTWVTRPDVHVDRIATAWLVRRFVDPEARFRFSPAPARRRAHEITFDVPGGDVTHEGDRCTFQVLLGRLRLEAAALRTIGEIVADIDLKETRHRHPETPGIERLVSGVAARHARDAERLERGGAIFDALHAALRAVEEAPAAPRKRRGKKRAR
ncbi:MAG TPA: chromate resistance protein ChrB domain-containing protein [Thermoanaerobaculia bacterium]|nr:chromate resistance protein ChrB domain-containing protein [Thermoanaerobaculia bacterium]